MLCGVLAFFVLVDFLIPGNFYIENVKSIDKNRQRYYNAAGNSHYSYKIKTENMMSDVSDKFAKKILVGEKVELELSLFFKEINSTEILKTSEKETYSLRMFSGLILPIYLLIILLLSFVRTIGKTLLFISGVLMVADFIYVLF